MESPEVHAPHKAHRSGLPVWLEWVTSVSALVVSISSIVIAVHHGQTMEKLVQANSIPYLQGGFSDITLEGDKVLSLDLLNRGVGPAHQKSLRVKANGRYVKSLRDLYAAALGPDAAQATARFEPVMMANRVPTRFIPGNQTQMVFRIPRTEENAPYWDRLKAAEDSWQVEFCYCSVFDDCWKVQSKWSEPARVKQCLRDAATEFYP